MKKYFLIPIALIVIFGLLFFVDYIVYESLIFGFLVSDNTALILLKIAIILSVGSVLSSLTSFEFNNFFTRWFYRISAFWIGFLFYLFFVSIIYVILLNFIEPKGYLVLILFLIAFITSLWGVIHAHIIKIKELNIELLNLPDVWKNRRVVFVSDLHLGQVYGERFTEKVCNKIRKINPDIIFIGGDIYDGTKVKVEEVIRPFSKLNIPLGIYFVMGNHEEFSSSNKIFLDAIRKNNIKVLLDQMVDIDGLQVVGVDYRTTITPKDYKKVLDSIPLDSSKASILLKHTPLHTKIAMEKGFSLQLSGHTHNAQIFPLNLLVRILFKGFGYGFRHHGDMKVFTSSGVGTWGYPMRIGTDSEIILINFL